VTAQLEVQHAQGGLPADADMPKVDRVCTEHLGDCGCRGRKRWRSARPTDR